MDFKIFFRLFLVFFFVVGLYFLGCNYNKFESDVTPENELSEESSFETSGVTWDFPFQYGKPGWDSFKSAEEQINAYNIPNEILNRLSTEELVKVCLNYPEWGLLYMYNDDRTGFSVLLKNFNGFRELFNRSDAAVELMKEYAKIDPLSVEPGWTALQQGLFGFQFIKIELFLSQSSIIRQLDNAGLRELRELALSKYKNKKMLPGIYSAWDLFPTVGVCVNIIEYKNASLLDSKRGEINHFKAYMRSDNKMFLDSIVELLKNNEL